MTLCVGTTHCFQTATSVCLWYVCKWPMINSSLTPPQSIFLLCLFLLFSLNLCFTVLCLNSYTLYMFFLLFLRMSGKRGVLKRPWSEAERAAVESHLVRNIMELRVPAKADCERCLEQCPLLVTNHRDWRAIKFYCHNRIQLLKKTQQRQSPPTLSVCWGGQSQSLLGKGRRIQR